MSFNFGSNLGANTTQQQQLQPQPGFGFGTPKPNTAAQPSGSITFGTPIASVAPTQQNAGISFGTPTMGTGTTTALNFSTPVKPAGLAFGTPAQTASQPALGFGSSQTAQPGLNFGTAANPTQPTLGFGTPATQPTLGFSTPATQPTLGFGTSAQTAQTGLSFGTPAQPGQTAQTGLSFGTPAQPGQTAQSGLSFGAQTAQTGLSFGAQTTQTGLNFGSSATAQTTSGLNFSGGSNLGVQTSSNWLSSLTPATNTNVNPLGGISFATSTAPQLSFKPATSTVTSNAINFGFNAPKTSSAIPIGLGGVDSSQLKTGAVSAGRTDTVAGKESQTPNEILQSIENFKQFVKDQKSQSSDVSRGSARPFVKVKEDMELISSVLTDVGNDLQRNQQQADKLKHDSAKCLHNAEMAQRTNDTPPGLQFENNAPMRYFIDLVNQFEQDLQALRLQIDVTDKHFQSLHEPKFLTSQELATGMRRLHDTFVALAGRLHSVHTQVESHKEQYLNLRKYILKDPTNIFIKASSKEDQDQALHVALRGLSNNVSAVSGPTPFSSFGINIVQAQQNAGKPPPAYPSATTSFGGGAPGTTPQLGSNTSLFGNTSLGMGQDSFQLQNPPLGNKRGKR